MNEASDFLDDTCKMKLLTTFNEQVKNMEEYKFIVPARTFIKRICAFIRKQGIDVNGCANFETSYEDGEDPIYARDIIKTLFMEKMQEIINNKGDEFSNFLLNYEKNPSEILNSQKGGKEPLFDTKDPLGSLNEIQNDGLSQLDDVSDKLDNANDNMNSFISDKTDGLSQLNNVSDKLDNSLSDNMPFKGTVAVPNDIITDNMDIINDPKLQSAVSPESRASSSEPEEIVTFLTEYMGDYVKCNKYAHEEIRNLLELVFNIVMEEFKDEDFKSIFENQSEKITNELLDEKIKIFEKQLEMLAKMIDETVDIKNKLEFSQKYILLMNDLFSVYDKKLAATGENFDDQLHRKKFTDILEKLPTYEKYIKNIFNGTPVTYETLSRVDRLAMENNLTFETEGDSVKSEVDEKGPPAAGDGPPFFQSIGGNTDRTNALSEGTSGDDTSEPQYASLVEKTLDLEKFSFKSGELKIEQLLYELLNEHINPNEEEEQDSGDENEDKEEDKEVSLPAAIMNPTVELTQGGRRKRKKRKYTKRKKPKTKRNITK